jgi:hypothetical protein
MAGVLGFRLLDDLRTLYQDHGGIHSCRVLPMRFLSPSEVADIMRAFRRNFPGLLDPCAGLFWTDDNSNYAGVFLDAPLYGRVFFLNHDEPDDTPRFRSVESFCQSMLAAAQQDQSWVDMTTDYPRLTDPADVEGDEDRALAIAYLRDMATLRWEDDAYSIFAYRALNLLPPRDLELVLPLFDSADFWVKERACVTVGLWRCAKAVPGLLRVARTTTHPNGRTAAVRALQRIGTPEAKEALKMLQAELGSELGWLFRTGPWR